MFSSTWARVHEHCWMMRAKWLWGSKDIWISGCRFQSTSFFSCYISPCWKQYSYACWVNRTLTLNGQNDGGIIRAIMTSRGIYSDAAWALLRVLESYTACQDQKHTQDPSQCWLQEGTFRKQSPSGLAHGITNHQSQQGRLCPSLSISCDWCATEK